MMNYSVIGVFYHGHHLIMAISGSDNLLNYGCAIYYAIDYFRQNL